MQPGLPTSIGLHLGLLALALVSWGHGHQEPSQPVEAIEVEIGDVTQLRLGKHTGERKDEIVAKDQAAAPKEREGKRAGTSKQEEPPPAPQAKPEAPKPEAPKEVASVPKEEPPPAPKPEPPKPVAKPEPPKTEEKPKAAEKAPEIAKEPPPPAPPKKVVEKKEPPKDVAALDKLLAKADTKPSSAKADAAKSAPAQAVPRPQSGFNSREISDILNKTQTGGAQGREAQTASLGSPNGVNAKIKMSVSELDAFMGQVQRCWNPPPGASDANLVARIQVVLERDGSLTATPQTIEAPSHPMGPAYAASAVRAIRMCAPYRLPPEKYEQWHDNVLTFVPKT
jgi:outer membrane biosynthesis protein TonB